MTPKRIPKKFEIILVFHQSVRDSYKGHLNSKGIRMNAADRPSLKTGNDAKKDSTEIKINLSFHSNCKRWLYKDPLTQKGSK